MKIIYKIVFAISMLLTIGAIVVLSIFGLKFGIDFTGGTVLEVQFQNQVPSSSDITETLKTTSLNNDITITPTDSQGFINRSSTISESTHQEILKALNDKYGTVSESRFEAVGPVIGNELKDKSIKAIIILLIVIVLYISLVFRSMAKVLSPWAMGIAAIVALIHDVIIPVGIFALLGHYAGVEITAIFIAAALTILGYSVADTVIVFDRVRENVNLRGKKDNFADIVHTSIMQTLTRSINTSLTTLITLFAILFWGGESLHYFALALIIGIGLGTYSSIFIASPILIWWESKHIKGKL